MNRNIEIIDLNSIEANNSDSARSSRNGEKGAFPNSPFKAVPIISEKQHEEFDAMHAHYAKCIGKRDLAFKKQLLEYSSKIKVFEDAFKEELDFKQLELNITAQISAQRKADLEITTALLTDLASRFLSRCSTASYAKRAGMVETLNIYDNEEVSSASPKNFNV